LHFYFCFY